MGKDRITLVLFTLVTLIGLTTAVTYISTNSRLNGSLVDSAPGSNSSIESILFSGDSISDGWYATQKSNGFVYRIQRELTPNASYHTHMHGYTVGQIAARYTVPSDLDLAIVELGTNDVNKGTPLTIFDRTYHDYVNRVRNQSPEATLICLGVFPASKEASRFDDSIQRTCEAKDGHFISMSDLSRNTRTVGPYGQNTWAGAANLGHPNDYGHAIITERILKALDQ